MKVPSLSVISSALVCLASVASARPFSSGLWSRQNAPVANATVAGAAYFMTNEASGNVVLVANIDINGRLTLVNAVSAAGTGSHGIVDPLGPDALFSQGSIVVSAIGNILVAVNAGSNTVAIFAINPAIPADIRMIGNPVSSEGQFPVSVAINKNATQVCVLNGGQINGVACFRVDPQVGLVSLNTFRFLGLPQTTPPSGPEGTVSDIIFSDDESQIIVAIKGVGATPGFLATFDVAVDGTLSQAFTVAALASGGLLPTSLTVIPGTTAVLATDAAIGFSVFDFVAGQNASANLFTVAGQQSTSRSAFSQGVGNFFLTDVVTAIVTEVNVDVNLTASIVKQYQQIPGSATLDNSVAAIGAQDFLFILSANTTSVDVLVLTAPGAAQPVQFFDFSQIAQLSGITINANNLAGLATFIKPATT